MAIYPMVTETPIINTPEMFYNSTKNINLKNIFSKKIATKFILLQV